MEALHHVLRIQHPSNKLGPFYSKVGVPDAKKINKIAGRLPAIHDDVTDYEALDLKVHLCGVEYYSQLFEWFGTELQQFWDAGYQLLLHTLPKSKILFSDSGLQVAFNPADVLETEILI